MKDRLQLALNVKLVGRPQPSDATDIKHVNIQRTIQLLCISSPVAIILVLRLTSCVGRESAGVVASVTRANLAALQQYAHIWLQLCPETK